MQTGSQVLTAHIWRAGIPFQHVVASAHETHCPHSESVDTVTLLVKQPGNCERTETVNVLVSPGQNSDMHHKARLQQTSAPGAFTIVVPGGETSSTHTFLRTRSPGLVTVIV